MVNIEYLHLLTPSLPRVGNMNQYESGGPHIGPVLASWLIHLLIRLLLTPSPRCSKKSQCRESWQRATTDSPPPSDAQEHKQGPTIAPTVGISYCVPLNPLSLKCHFSCSAPLCKYQSESRRKSWLKMLFCSLYSLLSAAGRFYPCLVGVYLIKMHYLPGLRGQNECYSAVYC